MRFHETLSDLAGSTSQPGNSTPVVLTIGNFDGLHLGHRAVIAQTQSLASACDGEAWLLTFDPHPCQIVAPATCQPALTTRSQKEALLRDTELDAAIFMPFEQVTADLEPEAFIAHLLSAIPTLSAVVVGQNWRFGRKAVGNFDTLRTLGAKLGFEVKATEIAEWDNERVSSTRIRKAISSGDLEAASSMLSRPHRVEGIVVKGRQLGRQQGFPTANIDCAKALLPPPGIYAVSCPVGEERWGGAAYLNQTLVDAGVIEVHFFDLDQDLYDRRFKVDLHKQLRPDREFESTDALVAQIARDVADARAVYASL